MLCCMSSIANCKQSYRSKQYDKLIDEERCRTQREVKYLLLGLKGSGKTTFLKQMRIIHGSGYTYDDKRRYTKSVYQNIFAAMQGIIQAMRLFQIPYDKESNKLKGDLISNVNCNRVSAFEKIHVDAIVSLWNDSGVQHAYNRRREYRLADSAMYFFTEIDRIASPGYLPTEQDILRIQTPTAGITEYSFSIYQTPFRLIDVGDQRSERRKWLHCFENVTSILLLVAVSDYDQISLDSKENRLEESKALFKSLVMCPWLYEASFMVLLNKKDIFEEKIMHSHLAHYFPDYLGPQQNAIEAREFILDMFTSLAISKEDITYYHYICAIDSENTELVFSAVRDTLLRVQTGNIFQGLL